MDKGERESGKATRFGILHGSASDSAGAFGGRLPDMTPNLDRLATSAPSAVTARKETGGRSFAKLS
jgi:hypothetical protein